MNDPIHFDHVLTQFGAHRISRYLLSRQVSRSDMFAAVRIALSNQGLVPKRIGTEVFDDEDEMEPTILVSFDDSVRHSEDSYIDDLDARDDRLEWFWGLPEYTACVEGRCVMFEMREMSYRNEEMTLPLLSFSGFAYVKPEHLWVVAPLHIPGAACAQGCALCSGLKGIAHQVDSTSQIIALVEQAREHES